MCFEGNYIALNTYLTKRKAAGKLDNWKRTLDQTQRKQNKNSLSQWNRKQRYREEQQRQDLVRQKKTLENRCTSSKSKERERGGTKMKMINEIEKPNSDKAEMIKTMSDSAHQF